MINAKDLELGIALTLATGHIKNETPQSLMIVSKLPESGKTVLVKMFKKVDGVAFISDTTAKGFLEAYRSELISGHLKHLVIPEFLAPLARNQHTVKSFLSTLQILIEDGFEKIDTSFIHQKYDTPRRIGVITCLPLTAFNQNKTSWMASGLLTRFLVMSYSYSDATVKSIFKSIMARQYLNEAEIDLKFDKEYDVELPTEVAQACETLALQTTEIARNTRKSMYGFRQLESIQRMVMAKVVLDKAQGIDRDNVTTMDDFNAVNNISYLFNDNFNEVRQ